MPGALQRIFLVAVWLGIPVLMYAQNGTSYLEGGISAGKIIRNFPEFPETPNQSWTGTLKFSRKLDGGEPWHRYYRYPVSSIAITAGTMGNNRVLGSFAGAGWELSFEKKLGSKWFWAPRLSAGAAWFSSPFDEANNPGNIVMGSLLSFLVSAEGVVGCNVSDHVAVFAKATIYHASNSHFKLPNVGMNLPALGAGVRYRIKGNDKYAADTTVLGYTKVPVFHIRLALGMNEQGASTGPVNGPRYPVYLVSAYFSKMVSPVNKVTAGVEGWFNKGSYDYILSQEIYDDQLVLRSMAAAVVAGHEFMMGHWSLVTTGGIYLYNPLYKKRLELQDNTSFKDRLKAYIPARIGMQYYFKNTAFKQSRNFFAGVYIKTNFGQADFLETGMGYMF